MSKIRDGVAEFELVLGKNKEAQSIESSQSQANRPGARRGLSSARKRNALGRGLSALMSSTAVQLEPGAAAAGNTALAPEAVNELPQPASEESLAETPIESQLESSDEAAEDSADGGLVYLQIEQLYANPKQPRQRFSQQEIDELAESIAQTGLLQPILARRMSEGPQSERAEALGVFEIVAGERRFRAAQQAGLQKVPVMLRRLDDREVLEISIVENVQRSQLDPLEEAEAYQRLKDEFGLSQEQIAETVGKDRATIANSLRLLKLGEEARKALIEGTLSAGHARTLLGVENARRQAAAVQRIVKDGLSVRASEELVRRLTADKAQKPGSAGGAGSRRDAQTQQLEERFRRALGTKVQLSLAKTGKGELKISFFSQEELEQLLELLNA